MGLREQLIRELADGQPHSGTGLAQALGVSRSAVWKQAHRLPEVGLGLQGGRGRGYQLDRPLELLDKDRIESFLSPASRDCCEALTVRGITGSTSTDLADQPAPAAGFWRAVVAEFQTGGRGRRGRRWLGAYGSGICLTLAWCYPRAPRDLPALSLAAGLAVRRALAAAGAASVALKWPNDLVLDGAKLGGILVDVDGDARGPLRVLVGAGVNLALPASLARQVGDEGGLQAAALEQALGGKAPARNALVASVLGALVDVLRQFDDAGFAGLATEWRAHDYLRGREVAIRRDGGVLIGIASGVSPEGALLVDHGGGRERVFGGDVTLRAAP